MPRPRRALLIPLMLGFLANVAQAQMYSFLGPIPKLAFDPGWYAGASRGYSHLSYAGNSLSIMSVTGETASSFSTNDANPLGSKLYTGYRLQRNLALEIGYADFGRFSATRNLTPPPGGSLHSIARIRGVQFDAVGILPLKRWFDLFGKVGAVVTTEKADLSTTGAVQLVGTHTRHTELNPKVGIGGDFRIWRTLAVRVEYEWIGSVGARSLGEGDIELYSVGIHYHF